MREISLLTIIGLLLFSGCKTETQESGACGDEIIDVGEDCDTTNLGGQSCMDRGYYSGTLTCNEDCTFNSTDCTNSGSCGDGVIQTENGEVCDTDEFAGETCVALGYNGGTLTCTASCEFDISACEETGMCGDGELQSDYEECEESSLFGATCESLGYYGGTLACVNETCVYNLTDCEANGYCGDGVIEPSYGETCDGTNLDALITCLDYDASYHDNGANVACSDSCQYDLSACEWCGDGILQSSFAEECDASDFDGLDCAAISFGSGSLSCDGGVSG